MQISSALFNKMRQAAIEEWPREACGVVILSHDYAQQFMKITNLSNQEDRFEMAPEELLPILTGPSQIIFLYHSHPRGPAIPSELDCRNTMYPWPHVIYSVVDDQFAVYETQGPIWTKLELDAGRNGGSDE